MDRNRTRFVLLLFAAFSAHAQEPAAKDPPEILKIIRESVLPGKRIPHATIAAERSQALSAAKWPTAVLALKPVTGPGDIFFLTGYDSFETWARDRKQMEKSPALQTKLDVLADRSGELVSQRRVITALYQKEISYRAKYDWSNMRCLDMITIQLRPGHGDEYLQNRQIVIEAHTKADLQERMAIYEVSSGLPSTTYLILRPVETFEGLDLEKIHGDKYGQILGDANRSKLHELFAASVQSEEEEYFCADPGMSYVTESWAGSNKDFWLGNSREGGHVHASNQ